MIRLEDHYPTRLQGIRRQGGTVQVYAHIPLPLASALDLEAGETVTWKVALGLEMEEVPMPKSTLQELEAKRVLHKRGEALLKKSIEEARGAGYLQSRKIRVALDTTPILGQGAVKDTYHLLAEGIEQRACRLAELEGETARTWAEGQGLSRYLGRTKTRLQVVRAAVVANVSLVAGYCKRQAKRVAITSAMPATAARTGLVGAALVVWSRLFTCPEPAWV